MSDVAKSGNRRFPEPLLHLINPMPSFSKEGFGEPLVP